MYGLPAGCRRQWGFFCFFVFFFVLFFNLEVTLLCVSRQERGTEGANAKRARGRRCVAVTRRAKWQQVAKELMSREGTCFTSDVSCCDTCPPWWLPVINIITSCWGELTKVPVPALSCAVPGLSVRWSERGPVCVCVFVKGMSRFYEDCAVNYSFRNVLLLACNPIVNALLVSLLHSPVVYANNWESVSPSVLKCALWTTWGDLISSSTVKFPLALSHYTER